MTKINEAVELRERVQDGELIPISAEDKQTASLLAAQLEEVMEGRPIIHALLAVQIFSVSMVEQIAGREWGKALDDVFKQIPIEN